MSSLSETRGVREVSAAGNRDGVGEADGSLMSPEVLRRAPGEGISARLGFPHIGKVVVFDCGWCVVLLMRYLGVVWGPGYPRKHVGAVLPPNFSEGRLGWSFQ